MKVPITARSRANGFSLVELLVVVGLIATLAAVSLPNLIGYFQSSRIRAAHNELATAIQRARTTAITRNTQLGVSLIVQDNTTYWVHIEDTIAGVTTGDVGYTRQGINFTTPNTFLSTKYQLPSGVEFAANSTDCPGVAGFTPANASLRFDRYGLTTLPPATGTTAIVLDGGSTTTTRIYAPASGDRSVCLIDRQTALRRWLEVSPAGRIARH